MVHVTCHSFFYAPRLDYGGMAVSPSRLATLREGAQSSHPGVNTEVVHLLFVH